MVTQNAIEILNELLAVESQSLSRRLMEATVFIPRTMPRGLEPVQRMARESLEHTEWLTELIVELGGEPDVRFLDPTSADLHYQELGHAVPRLVKDHEKLIRMYTQAARRVDSVPEIGNLVSRILARHQEHADTLKKLCNGATPHTPLRDLNG